jgi:hypothetical protein
MPRITTSFFVALAVFIVWLTVCQLIYMQVDSLSAYSTEWKIVTFLPSSAFALASIWWTLGERRSVRLAITVWLMVVLVAILIAPAFLCAIARDCF